jgi:streptogramin lyase
MIGRLTDEQLDARLSAYLTFRAEAVAGRAASAQDVTNALALRLGVARRRQTFSTTRLVFAILLLILALLAAAVVGGVFRERYAPNRPLVETTLDGQPWAVTAAYGSIWTGAYRAPDVYVVDPADGSVRNDVRVVGFICGTIEAGYGALWVSHCDPNALSRIDARTLEVQRLVGFASDQVGIGAGAVWTAHDDSVARLDPVSLATLAETPVGGGALVAFGEGSVWAAVPDAGVVRRIDPATNQVSATIAFDDLATGDAYPVHLATGGGAVWVVDEHELAVYRIDPRTNTAQRLGLSLQFFAGTSFGDWYIRYGRGLVWVRQTETTIVAIDPRTFQVVETHQTPLGGGGGFFVADDSLWVGNNRAGTLSGVQLP